MSTDYNIFGGSTMSFPLSYKWVSIFEKITENAGIMCAFKRFTKHKFEFCPCLSNNYNKYNMP